MRTNEKLWDICMKIYRAMYKKSTPSVDFDKLIKSGESKKEGFFYRYYLDAETQQKIMDRIFTLWNKKDHNMKIYLDIILRLYDKLNDI